MHRVGCSFLSIKLCACRAFKFFLFLFLCSRINFHSRAKIPCTHCEFLESNSCIPYPGRNKDKLISKGKKLDGINWDIAKSDKACCILPSSPFLHDKKKRCVSKLGKNVVSPYWACGQVIDWNYLTAIGEINIEILQLNVK